MRREASVMGKFYPAQSETLDTMIETWKREPTLLGGRAAIVPHAGYVYSGECAWRALTRIDWTEMLRVVVIGPSHRFPFSGVSVFTGDEFTTVGGIHPSDAEFAKELIQELNINFIEQAHFEHSTEVQFPLIHTLAPHAKIIECVYGDRAGFKLEAIIAYIMQVPRTALLISSDLSHYNKDAEARILDEHIIEAIEYGDMCELEQGEACGKPGIRALINFCNEGAHRLQVVDYRTSADSKHGNSDSVVGYLSAIMV